MWRLRDYPSPQLARLRLLTPSDILQLTLRKLQDVGPKPTIVGFSRSEFFFIRRYRPLVTVHSGMDASDSVKVRVTEVSLVPWLRVLLPLFIRRRPGSESTQLQVWLRDKIGRVEDVLSIQSGAELWFCYRPKPRHHKGKGYILWY